MQHIIVNGLKTDYIHCKDRGLHYGDGVFETIKCIEGGLIFWDEHIQRMRNGANRLNINFSDENLFYSDIQSIFSELSNKSCIIKLILTRGHSVRGYKYSDRHVATRVVIIDEMDNTNVQHTGVEVGYCKHTISVNPSLAGIKHLNRLDNVLARNEWNNEILEGLMLDMDGNVIEGTMSNIVGIKHGILYTPDLSRCGVEGIIRGQVLQIAQQQKIKSHINNITVSDIATMDEVFITNSIIDICPVQKITETSYDIGPTTEMFIEELTKRTKTHVKNVA